jgi:tRNA-2-methylthio-N6-dimethylallyladenosine synthase
VPGLLRLRYTTSHPKDFTDRVADAFRELRTMTSWLHLPVQAGSSRTLRRMVRGYTREEYVRKLDYVRAVCPDISLSTDIIVGYPGETDADFAETLSLLEYAQYDSIYSFEYSERPDTPALKLSLRDDVPAAVKAERLQIVQALQQTITLKRLQRFVGRTAEVLVEGEARSSTSQLCGRLSGNEMVNFAAPAGVPRAQLVGQLVPVRITAARTHTLAGEYAGQGAALRLPMVAS